MAKRRRSISSLRGELVRKSREAALTAVKVFNDPLIQFKSETFIVLMVIAWTYLLHAYYRSRRIDYRHFKQGPKRRRFDRTKHGAHKYWDLERCLDDKASPVDLDTATNLRFLIGLRHEIEHQMTRALDSYLSGRYQACALNYNDHVKKLFGDKFGLDQHLAYSIQFAELAAGLTGEPRPEGEIPAKVQSYITTFDSQLSGTQFNSPRYSYRLFFTKKLANRPGQADRVIEFIQPDSELAKTIEKEYWVKKEVERPKYRAKDVVAAVKKAGVTKFRVQAEHLAMWKAEDAKNPSKGYGVDVQGTWFWYDRWVQRCIELCKAAGERLS